MARYNDLFELSVSDIQLIEDALRVSKSSLSDELVRLRMENFENSDSSRELEESIRRIQQLLGRLHNQKVFYRPRDVHYISG
ncbi:MAG: hypothetical protein OXC72_10190 [Roseovarius sp.]|nr:hypothetical protein [Roseovarius sp.]MCY4292109.1 hypothetical protein [Roseovarius sp.]MCY4316006.1 hypothetical protein [Roseovarius sp.]